jgi:hypothetical protein
MRDGRADDVTSSASNEASMKGSCREECERKARPQEGGGRLMGEKLYT